MLKPISTLYIPYDYSFSGTAKYQLSEGASEQSAYDPANAMVYTVGKYAVVSIKGCTPSRNHQLDGT